jgi:hypothetical protein
MNQAIYSCAPKNTAAYGAAQSALQPISEALQVDDSLSALRSAVEFHNETVRALLRRLEPVTIQYGSTASEIACDVPSKVQLSMNIDYQVRLIGELTMEVQDAIRALQI